MVYDICCQPGSSILVCGPSGSGRTSLVSQIIKTKEYLFHVVPQNIFLFYTQPQEIYEDLMRNGLITKMLYGYPSYDELRKIVAPYKDTNGSIILLDDQLSGISEDLIRIFHKLSHHCNATCFFLSQNLFFANKKYRSISLNANYMILMKNVRDQSQIMHLAKQFAPYREAYVVQSFMDVSKKMFGYMVFDYHQKSTDITRIRINILPHEAPVAVFIEIS